MYRPPSRRQTAFVITDDLVDTPLVTPRQLSALQGNVIQLIGTWGCALRFSHLLQSCLGKLEGIPKHRRSIEKGPCGAHWSR